MNSWALLWLVIFAVAATLFFGVAAVIAVIGAGDLKDLLTPERTNRNDGPASSGRPEDAL
jgi:hypothetical protein